MKFKILNINIFIILLCFVNLVSICILFYNLGQSSSSKTINKYIDSYSSGRVIIQVIDEFTNQPVDGATVCILETRHYENTNKYGSTSAIEVPIIPNDNFDLYLKRSWGELTILVYKNGYADNISFYNLVMPGSTRVGLTIRLREIINDEDKSPTVSTEKPNQEWIDTLIKLYKKRI